jgi:hypothetical protein
MTALSSSPSELAREGVVAAQHKCRGAGFAFAVATLERLVNPDTAAEATASQRAGGPDEPADAMWRQACLAPQLRLGAGFSTAGREEPILVHITADLQDHVDEIAVIEVYQAQEAADVADIDVVDVVDVFEVLII